MALWVLLAKVVMSISQEWFRYEIFSYSLAIMHGSILLYSNAGATSEMVGDASSLVGDAFMDGLASAGSAVADAAIGVATDTAIGGTTMWGVWDGIHRVLPSWLFTGGAVVLGSELAFAAFAFYVASTSFGNEAVIEDEPVVEAKEMRVEILENVPMEEPVRLPTNILQQNEIEIAGVLKKAEMALDSAEKSMLPCESVTASSSEYVFHRKLLEKRIHYDEMKRAREREGFQRRLLEARIHYDQTKRSK